MVAGRTSGGSMGGVGGASRGAAGIATRGGGGIESRGGASGGKSFGNTSRFESSFSGRSLATAPRTPRTESRGAPLFSISKSGALEHHAPSAVKSIDRPKSSGRQTPRQAFGPRIDAVRSHSVDSHKPGRSAFSETKPMYVSKADAKYHAHPGHSRFHSEPQRTTNKEQKTKNQVAKSSTRSFGLKLEAVKKPSPDTHRPQEFWTRNTRTLFSRSETSPKPPQTSRPKTPEVSPKVFGSKLEEVRAQSPDTHRPQVSPTKDTAVLYQRPEMRPKVSEAGRPAPVKEQHQLYKTTEALDLARVRTNLQTLQHSTDPARSQYERTGQNVDPKTQHIAISSSGERTVIKGKIDGSGRWNHTLEKKAASAQSIKIGETHKTVKPETERVVKNDAYKTLQKKTEAVAPKKSNLLATTEPLQVTSPAQLERKVKEDLNNPQKQIGNKQRTAQRIEATSEKPTVQALTYAETQRVLDKYAQQTREKAGLPATQTKQISLAEIQNQEARADIEQAARLMRAYQDVLKTGTYASVTTVQAEQAVLKALDQKLERTQGKTAIIAQIAEPLAALDVQTYRSGTLVTTVEPGRAVIVQEEKALEPHAISLTPEVADLLERLQIDPELLPATIPTVESQTKTQPVTTTAVVEQTDEQVSTSTAVKTRAVQGTNVAGAVTLLQEAEEEEKEEEEQLEAAEQAEALRLLETELPFERDEIKNTIRITVVIYISIFIQYIRREQIIAGSSIAERLVQIYDPLISDIVPEGRPDDNLTALIEGIAERDYESVADVVSEVTTLAQKYPAITIGEKNNIPPAEALRIRNSTQFPSVASRSINHRIKSSTIYN